MKNDKIVIEIEKKKILNYVLVIVGVFLVCVISFAISNSNSEKYKEQNNSNNTEVDENDILQTATKDAGEVADDEREEAKEIGAEDYLALYNGKEDKLILFASPTCSYCKIAIPILENIIYEQKIEINYLNTGNLSAEDKQKIIESDEYFKEGYGTPLILVVKDGTIVDKIDGLVPKESYETFFKQYGFME